MEHLPGEQTLSRSLGRAISAFSISLRSRRSAVAFETVEGHSRILADLDEIAVGITHVAASFPAVIV